jgi:hypothetical protein
MLRLTRPQLPSDFEVTVDPLRQRIYDTLAGHRRLITTRSALKRGKSARLDFPTIWSKYKPLFAQAQHGKCGYCEIDVIGGQAGDVDHFWPKGEVWELEEDDATWGREHPWASTVTGRKRKVLAEQGYWWKAYQWTNYVLACIVCNEYWKLSFFPVQNEPRAIPPTEQTTETPLLLDPYDAACNPGEHLRFTELGHVEVRNGSRVGFETIRTLGLDRESLRRLRQRQAQRAYRLARELVAADDTRTNQILFDFSEMGQPQNAFAGMVRIIFEEQCGVAWSDLDCWFKGYRVRESRAT